MCIKIRCMKFIEITHKIVYSISICYKKYTFSTKYSFAVSDIHTMLLITCNFTFLEMKLIKKLKQCSFGVPLVQGTVGLLLGVQ